MSKTVSHKVTWETTVIEEKPKSWWHKLLGYTPVDHHVHILEGTIHTNPSNSLDMLLKSLHGQVKMVMVNEEDPHFKSHNGIRYRRNIRDNLLKKKDK